MVGQEGAIWSKKRRRSNVVRRFLSSAVEIEESPAPLNARSHYLHVNDGQQSPLSRISKSSHAKTVKTAVTDPTLEQSGSGSWTETSPSHIHALDVSQDLTTPGSMKRPPPRTPIILSALPPPPILEGIEQSNATSPTTSRPSFFPVTSPKPIILADHKDYSDNSTLTSRRTPPPNESYEASLSSSIDSGSSRGEVVLKPTVQPLHFAWPPPQPFGKTLEHSLGKGIEFLFNANRWCQPIPYSTDQDGDSDSIDQKPALLHSVPSDIRSDFTGASTQVATNRAVDIAMRRVRDMDRVGKSVEVAKKPQKHKIRQHPPRLGQHPIRLGFGTTRFHPGPMEAKSILSASSNDSSFLRSPSLLSHDSDSQQQRPQTTIGKLGRHVGKQQQQGEHVQHCDNWSIPSNSLSSSGGAEPESKQPEKSDPSYKSVYQRRVPKIPSIEAIPEGELEGRDRNDEPDLMLPKLVQTFARPSPTRDDSNLSDEPKETAATSVNENASCLSPPPIVRQLEQHSPDPIFCPHSSPGGFLSRDAESVSSHGSYAAQGKIRSSKPALAQRLHQNRPSNRMGPLRRENATSDVKTDTDGAEAEISSHELTPMSSTKQSPEPSSRSADSRTTDRSLSETSDLDSKLSQHARDDRNIGHLKDELEVTNNRKQLDEVKRPVSLPPVASSVNPVISKFRSYNEWRSRQTIPPPAPPPPPKPMEVIEFARETVSPMEASVEEAKDTIGVVEESKVVSEQQKHENQAKALRTPKAAAAFLAAVSKSYWSSTSSKHEPVVSKLKSHLVKDALPEYHIDTESRSIQSLRSAFESVKASAEDSSDDDTVSVKSLKEKFEPVNKDPPETGVSKMRSLFEKSRTRSSQRFETGNNGVKQVFTRFESLGAKPSNLRTSIETTFGKTKYVRPPSQPQLPQLEFAHNAEKPEVHVLSDAKIRENDNMEKHDDQKGDLNNVGSHGDDHFMPRLGSVADRIRAFGGNPSPPRAIPRFNSRVPTLLGNKAVTTSSQMLDAKPVVCRIDAQDRPNESKNLKPSAKLSGNPKEFNADKSSLETSKGEVSKIALRSVPPSETKAKGCELTTSGSGAVARRDVNPSYSIADIRSRYEARTAFGTTNNLTATQSNTLGASDDKSQSLSESKRSVVRKVFPKVPNDGSQEPAGNEFINSASNSFVRSMNLFAAKELQEHVIEESSVHEKSDSLDENARPRSAGAHQRYIDPRSIKRRIEEEFERKQSEKNAKAHNERENGSIPMLVVAKPVPIKPGQSNKTVKPVPVRHVVKPVPVKPVIVDQLNGSSNIEHRPLTPNSRVQERIRLFSGLGPALLAKDAGSNRVKESTNTSIVLPNQQDSPEKQKTVETLNIASPPVLTRQINHSIQMIAVSTYSEHNDGRIGIEKPPANHRIENMKGMISNDQDDGESDSEFSDGVTLDLSIAEVSGLTNPTALISKAGEKSVSTADGGSDESSSRGIDLIEASAKHSEASSSQTSEAAAPLIANAMRLRPMSDDVSYDSFFSKRAVIAKHWSNTSGWEAVDREAKPEDANDTIKNDENSVDNSSGGWNIERVQSNFPLVEQPLATDIFDFESDWKLSPTVDIQLAESKASSEELGDLNKDAGGVNAARSDATEASSRAITPTRGNTWRHYQNNIRRLEEAMHSDQIPQTDKIETDAQFDSVESNADLVETLKRGASLRNDPHEESLARIRKNLTYRYRAVDPPARSSPPGSPPRQNAAENVNGEYPRRSQLHSVQPRKISSELAFSRPSYHVALQRPKPHRLDPPQSGGSVPSPPRRSPLSQDTSTTQSLESSIPSLQTVPRMHQPAVSVPPQVFGRTHPRRKDPTWKRRAGMVTAATSSRVEEEQQNQASTGNVDVNRPGMPPRADSYGSIGSSRTNLSHYGAQHAALMARLKALKEARIRRAQSALFNVRPFLNARPEGDEHSQSTRSSTHYGGSKFSASLEVE